MKTLALAGLVTISAIAGSAITLTLSQTSFAQDQQSDDKHWTQQHPAGQAAAQQQAAQGGQNAAAGTHSVGQYTQYKIIRVNGAKTAAGFENAVSNAMADGWFPVGNYRAACNAFDCNYGQAVIR